MGRRTEPTAGARAPASGERRAAFRLGVSAEIRAAALLLAQGYGVVARRFRTPVGEIDLVARRGNELIFVEVKARDSLDDAAEAVTGRQRRRIIAAAEVWLARHPDDVTREVRFDVILVAPRRWPRHIRAAFET